MSPLKLVLFDALHTLITPRRPIHIQYAQIFEPYLGPLEPTLIQSAFESALKEMQREKPAYAGGKKRWWGEVISRAAIGAGANPQAVRSSLGTMVPKFLERFSGKQGYKVFHEVPSTLKMLKQTGLRAGVVSNSDLRLKDVLFDLGLLEYLDPVLISEEEGIEKPTKEIWERACGRAGVSLGEALHVGDELECDYLGAKRAGLSALLVRRTDKVELDEDLKGVETVANLTEVMIRVSERI